MFHKNSILSLSLVFLMGLINAQEITPTILKKIKASEFKLDENNGDGVFVARNTKTKKWGMYQALSKNDIKELIPPMYDSIDVFGFNAKLTGVWLEGKVGIYMSPWVYGEEDAHQTVECLYEAYKRINVERSLWNGSGLSPRVFVYVAVKKGGLWAWIDWMTGELQTDFLYDLEKEKMPYPEFDQEN